MRQTFILVAAALISSTTAAQQPNLDSLLVVWNDTTRADSDRVAAYEAYIWEGYLFSRPDTAELLAEALNAYAEQHRYPLAAAFGNNLQGCANSIQGNYPRALDRWQNCLTAFEEIGDKVGIAGSLHNIARVYMDQGEYSRALEYQQKSLALREEVEDKNGIAESLNDIGLIYQYQGDHPRALEYYQKCLAVYEELGEKNGIAGSLNNVGITFRHQGDHPRALEQFQKSLAIREELGDQDGIAESLVNMGVSYEAQGKPALALDYCQKSLALAEEVGAFALQKDACQCLYDAYKAMGNTGNALLYYERMVAHRDSMFNEENTKKLTRLGMQYDFDKKEAATLAEQERKDAIAAQELERQKLVRNGIGGGLAFALLFLGVVWHQRNRISKEKKRSEELLLNILPAEVAEELKLKGSAEAVHIDQVTVLFTDFKGFTAMSETMSPQELVRDLNECFSVFDRITEKFGIEKIKTIGDAYMAAGGLPTPNTTHATDVIKAALEMNATIAAVKALKLAKGLPYFEIRIGIHTGPVVAGIVGVKKFQYDIWGDTVNTASRMESSGEVGLVNISEATYALVKGETGLTFTPRGRVQAKGKGEMEMYFVRSS